MTESPHDFPYSALEAMDQTPGWVSDDGMRLVAAGLGLCVFSSRPWSQQRETLLAGYQASMTSLGSERFRFFATETMSRHRAVGKSAFEMLPTWLADDAPERDFVSLDLKGGVGPGDASGDRFNVFGAEPSDPEFDPLDATGLCISFGSRPAFSTAAHTWIESLFLAICSRIELVSGNAGFVLNTSPYAERPAHMAAWRSARRYLGFDIPTLVSDCVACSQAGLKGLNWLTALGWPVLDSLGGKDAVTGALPASVTAIELPTGIVLKIGDLPSVLDVNRGEDLTDFRHVYHVLSPAIQYFVNRSAPLQLEEDKRENTASWLRRYADA